MLTNQTCADFCVNIPGVIVNGNSSRGDEKFVGFTIVFKDCDNTRCQDCQWGNMVWQNTKWSREGWNVNLLNTGLVIMDSIWSSECEAHLGHGPPRRRGPHWSQQHGRSCTQSHFVVECENLQKSYDRLLQKCCCSKMAPWSSSQNFTECLCATSKKSRQSIPFLFCVALCCENDRKMSL